MFGGFCPEAGCATGNDGDIVLNVHGEPLFCDCD